MYQSTERTCRAGARSVNYFIHGFYGTSIFMLPIVHPIYAMFDGNFDTATWYYPFSTDTFFDEGTPLGWYMRLAINAFGTFVYFFGLICISYVAFCCLYIRTCCKHFQLMVDQWDELVSNEGRGKDGQITEMLLENIKRAIQFQIKIVEWVIRLFCRRMISFNGFTL